MAIDTESVAIKPQTDFDTDCIHEQLSVITDLLVISHLQDMIAKISNQLTIARSCNLCTGKAYLISTGHNLPRAISYDPRYSRGQLHKCACFYVLIQFVSKYHRAISHHIDAYTFCANHSKFMEEFPYTKTLNT